MRAEASRQKAVGSKQKEKRIADCRFSIEGHSPGGGRQQSENREPVYWPTASLKGERQRAKIKRQKWRPTRAQSKIENPKCGGQVCWRLLPLYTCHSLFTGVLTLSFLETRSLTKQYGPSVYALKHVTFSVTRGEWVAVMGPSGSGKSTLLNIVGCLDTPTDGTVVLDGQDLAQLSKNDLARFRAEKVGFIFQQFHLIPYLTALENVMLAQYFHSLADEKEAAEALERVGLGERLRHLPHQLSGGEQQRVCVARALINQPNLILADEPTGNLDEVNETIVMGLLADLHREGHTILMVTHDPEISRMAERRLDLHHGRLTEVSSSPQDERLLVDRLLQAVWRAMEAAGRDSLQTDALPEFTESRATFTLMAQDRVINLESGRLTLTSGGQARADELMRRHRLAERLFYETFGLDEDVLHDNAVKVEPLWTPAVTEKICIFLNHPQTCPHGDPIPRGACCPER
jgi:putative ABC transport system ATP-binding protein